MATMHGIRMHDYGGPEVLSFEEAPRPEAGAGEVLVRIHAAGVNPIDWKLRAGETRSWIKLTLPAVPGLDFSGTVEALGSGVTKFKVGDEVFGRTALSANGAYAEFTVVKDRKPSEPIPLVRAEGGPQTLRNRVLGHRARARYDGRVAHARRVQGCP